MVLVTTICADGMGYFEEYQLIPGYGLRADDTATLLKVSTVNPHYKLELGSWKSSQIVN